MPDDHKEQKVPPQTGKTFERLAYALFALTGLSLLVSPFLPYRVLMTGGASVSYSGMELTRNLSWILTAMGLISFLVGLVGAMGRRIPSYAVLLAPGCAVLFSGFFLLLFLQLAPSVEGQRYVLVTDMKAWGLAARHQIESSMGSGLMLSLAASLLSAVLAYPVFRLSRTAKTAGKA